MDRACHISRLPLPFDNSIFAPMTNFLKENTAIDVKMKGITKIRSFKGHDAFLLPCSMCLSPFK